MFKIFQGFHLLESLQILKQDKRKNALPKNMIGLVLTLVVTLTLWNMPIEKFGIPELTIVQQRAPLHCLHLPQ